MKTSDPPVIVEHLFNNTATEVWSAITNRDQMVKWFFDNIPDFKAEVGFQTQFNVKAPSRDFIHLWKVLEVVPNERLVYRWNFEGLQGEFNSIFEIEQFGTKTKLTLTAEVIEDFDDTIPEFKRESGIAGWNYFINERLQDYLKT